MEMIFINNKPIKIVNWDLTVLQISEEIGISIPRFCYHQALSIAGNCRMCMVEIEKSIKPVIACATSISNDMVIFTNSELVKNSRENVLELLLINHPLDCPICDQGGECDLQDEAFIFGTDRGRFIDVKRSVDDKEFGPIVKTIMTRCIHCTRCVRFTREIAGIPVLGTMGRGSDTEISTYVELFFDSEIIGNIVDLCPVGALTSKPYAFRARSWELQSTEAFDIFDSLCSNIRIDVKDNEIMRVLPRRNDYVNHEWITDKVRFFYEGAKINRLLFPLIRLEKENIIVHTSAVYAFDSFINLYNDSVKIINKSNISIIQDNIDVLESIYYLKLMDLLDFNLFNFDNNSKSISGDLRSNWLLNDTINAFIEKNSVFVFCNTNLRYENAILNTLLFSHLNNTDNEVLVYYIGCYFKNTYNFIHLGLTNYTLMLIQEGKHFLSLILCEKDAQFIDSHINSFFIHNISEYVASFVSYTSQIKPNQTFYSYIASNSGILNNLEVGISFDIPENKEYNILFFMGNDANCVLPTSDYMIYMGHHMPHNLNFDIYFPVNCFFEVSQQQTISYWLDLTYHKNSYSDRIITPPGDIMDNISMCKILAKLYIDNFEFDIEKVSMFNYFVEYQGDVFFFYSDSISLFIENEYEYTIGLSCKWDSSIFYLADEYMLNNYVMREAYNNNKKQSYNIFNGNI